MFTAHLFYGFPLDSECSHQLNSLNPSLLSSFIRDDDAYLKELIFEGVRYVGKNVGESVDLAELELLDVNIYSILIKLLPNYPCQKTPLVLLATQNA